MSKKNDCWGIEVGSHAIKAIRLVRDGEKVTVADYDILPFKQILTTPDLNVDEAIQLNLDMFLSKRSLSRSTVVVSVPGNAAFARFAKLPPVEPKRIPDIVKFEAVQQIPFPIDQVEWDYQVFSQPDSPDVEVGIFAIMRDRVNQYLANYKAVGLEVDAVTLSPLAVFNALSYDMELDENSPGVIFMDIGTSITDVIVVEEGRLWLRTLSKGGNNFTEALVRSFKLSYSKAEKLKREAATSKYARQIFSAMRPVFADLVQEMQRSLGFYQSLNRDANLTQLVGVGSTFRLPGMQKFLKQQLQLDVTRPDGFKRLEVDSKIASEFSEHALSMVTAYGLAIQGLGLAKVEANIMPKAILKQRNWRSKQPWMMAAAAMFVAASAFAYTKLWNEQQKVTAEQKITSNTAGRVIAKANSLKDEFNRIKDSAADPRQKIENLRRILDYRDVWPKMMYDINQAALSLSPQPSLMTPNYVEIKNIKRDQRRRIFINKITTEYRFGAANVDPELAGPSAWVPPNNNMMDMNAYDDAMNEQPPEGGGFPPTAGGQGAFGEELAGPTDVPPPAFVIIIEGTTPYQEGPRLVSDGFLKWFKDHGAPNGRPYKISAKGVETIALSKIGGEVTPGIAPGPRRPGMRDRGGQFNTPQPGSGFPVFGNPENTVKANTLLEDILPTLPTADEPIEADWKFICRFIVQIVTPEEARQAEVAEAKPTTGGPSASAGNNVTTEVIQ